MSIVNPNLPTPGMPNDALWAVILELVRTFARRYVYGIDPDLVVAEVLQRLVVFFNRGGSILPAALKVFLKKTVLRTALELKRRESRIQKVDLDQCDQWITTSRFEAGVLGGIFVRAVVSLVTPERFLRYWEMVLLMGKSEKEAMDALELTAGARKTFGMRARIALAKAYARYQTMGGEDIA